MEQTWRKAHWKLTKKRGKVLLWMRFEGDYTSVLDNYQCYHRMFDIVNLKMVMFLMKETIQKSTYIMSDLELRNIQQRIGDIVYNKLNGI